MIVCQTLLAKCNKFRLDIEKMSFKIHKHRDNGYIDLKTGGYGVIVHSKGPPSPGDRVLFPLYDGNTVEEIVQGVLHERQNRGGQLNQYTCSIQSQDQADKIMSGSSY